MSHVHICPYCNQILDDRDEYNVIAIAWGEFAHKECDRKKSWGEEYDDPDPSDYFQLANKHSYLSLTAVQHYIPFS